MKNKKILLLLTVIELVLILLEIYLDFFLPTIVILVFGLAFLFIRKEGFGSLGFKRTEKPLKLIFTILGIAVIWTAVDFGLVLPILNHLTGLKRDVSAFADIKGSLGQLLIFLGLSWTLAAFGEELAYRGFLQTRIGNLLGDSKASLIISVVISSALFGFVHREQGIVGIITTFIDALFYSFIRFKFKNIWASVLAHGFMNSIGVITFFFTGPLYGLW